MNVILRGLKNKNQKTVLSQFCRKVCQALPQLRSKGEISFIFLSDHQIRKVNRRFLKHDFATDVISFSYPVPTRLKDVSPFGDICISIDIARREAARKGYSVVRELALYALHGLLHLIGYDDHSPGDRKKMFAEQARIFQNVAPRLAPPDLTMPPTIVYP